MNTIKDILDKGKASQSKDVLEVKTSEQEQADKQNYQWEPAPALDQLDGLDLANWAYRWVEYSRIDNLRTKAREGWTFVNTLEGDKVEHNIQGKKLTGWINDPKVIESTFVTDRGMILMKLPRYMAEARRRYIEGVTNEKLQTVTDQAKDTAAKTGGLVHGEVKIQHPNAGLKIIS